MIVMALDHVRDFFHTSATLFQPDDPARTTAALFFTRWVTHICAPVFMFTAGVSAFLWLRANHTRFGLSRFLWTRGLWLVALEVSVIHFALSFGAGPVILNVLWALGWSMVILGFLIYLSVPVLAVLSLATIALHNLTDGVKSTGWLWTILHRPGVLSQGAIVVRISYPLAPWFAVMAAGFCFGRIMLFETARRRRWMLRIGMGAITAFVVLRGLNVYGDPQPRSHGTTAEMTLLSFLRCGKYPPSLDYLLMTLGPALLLLTFFDGRGPMRESNPLIVFGRVPLFYFILHLYAIHLLAVLLPWLRSGQLLMIYLVWALIVALMYPACRWYAGLKSRRRDWWLGYL